MTNGSLSKLKLRNPAYKGLEPFFTDTMQLHTMHVTSSTEAFNPRASFRMIRQKQTVVHELHDVSDNSNPISPHDPISRTRKNSEAPVFYSPPRTPTSDDAPSSAPRPTNGAKPAAGRPPVAPSAAAALATSPPTSTKTLQTPDRKSVNLRTVPPTPPRGPALFAVNDTANPFNQMKNKLKPANERPAGEARPPIRKSMIGAKPDF